MIQVLGKLGVVASLAFGAHVALADTTPTVPNMPTTCQSDADCTAASATSVCYTDFGLCTDKCKQDSDCKGFIFTSCDTTKGMCAFGDVAGGMPGGGGH